MNPFGETNAFQLRGLGRFDEADQAAKWQAEQADLDARRADMDLKMKELQKRVDETVPKKPNKD
jgi:hypothetical protein